MQVSVVVVGGGPTGLMLAAELGLGGVQAIVLERLAAPTGLSKALGLQSRSMEMFDQRGILERFEAEGAPAPFVQFALFRIDLRRLAFPHPHTLAIPQAKIEAILEQWAIERGADIRRGHEAVELSQDAAGVDVRVRAGDGDYTLHAEYVVGCDGAHSLVRHAAGIDFPGTEPTAIGRLGDFRLGPQVLEPLHAAVPELGPAATGVARTPTGNVAIVALGDGVYRLAAIEWNNVQVDRDAPVTLDEMRAALRRVSGVDLELTDPVWMSRTTDTARLADRYRSGCVFVAGDAAHIHFAYGGMGLQTGVQDASNLGWKLASVVRGWAPDALLDSYHHERHAVGERLMMSTRAQVLLSSPGEHVTALRHLFAELMALDSTACHIAELFTSVDVHYEFASDAAESHPFVGRFVPDLLLQTDFGQVRVAQLMRAGGGLLLDLGTTDSAIPETVAPWAKRVRFVRAARTRDGAAPPLCAALVRPDGYVAWATDDTASPTATSGLREALQTWFGQP